MIKLVKIRERGFGMRAFVTKYALSKGILEVEGSRRDKGRGLIVWTNGHMQFFYGNDWHETREAALARAEQMRDNRVKSLRKQIARLESLTWDENGLPSN